MKLVLIIYIPYRVEAYVTLILVPKIASPSATTKQKSKSLPEAKMPSHWQQRSKNKRKSKQSSRRRGQPPIPGTKSWKSFSKRMIMKDVEEILAEEEKEREQPVNKGLTAAQQEVVARMRARATAEERSLMKPAAVVIPPTAASSSIIKSASLINNNSINNAVGSASVVAANDTIGTTTTSAAAAAANHTGSTTTSVVLSMEERKAKARAYALSGTTTKYKNMRLKKFER